MKTRQEIILNVYGIGYRYSSDRMSYDVLGKDDAEEALKNCSSNGHFNIKLNSKVILSDLNDFGADEKNRTIRVRGCIKRILFYNERCLTKREKRSVESRLLEEPINRSANNLKKTFDAVEYTFKEWKKEGKPSRIKLIREEEFQKIK